MIIHYEKYIVTVNCHVIYSDVIQLEKKMYYSGFQEYFVVVPVFHNLIIFMLLDFC